eukprot:gene4067-4314_t
MGDEVAALPPVSSYLSLNKPAKRDPDTARAESGGEAASSAYDDAYGSIEPYDEDYGSLDAASSDVYSPDDKVVIDITDRDQVLQLATFLDKAMPGMPQEQQELLKNMDMAAQLTVVMGASNAPKLADLVTQQVFLASSTASADVSPEYGFPEALPNSNLDPHLEGRRQCLPGVPTLHKAPKLTVSMATQAPERAAVNGNGKVPQVEKLELSELTAVSPLDGRYGRATHPLRHIFRSATMIKVAKVAITD